MDPLRLAMITRRFWPHCGPAEMAIADMAEAIQHAGHYVEVLTIRWDRKWTGSFRFRDFEVKRISRSVSGPWGMFRYLRKLNRQVHESRLDGIVVYGLQNESWAAIRNFAKTIPVVVYVDGQEMRRKNQPRFSAKQLATLHSTRQILVDSKTTAKQLARQHGLDPALISIVPAGVCIDREYQRSLARQAIARAALSDAHPILQIEPAHPLVVCGSSQFSDLGMDDLINAWPHVLDRYPEAKLWLLGDGLKARRVWESICDLGVADSVIMPGFFDAWEDVFQAADVYVHPLRANVSCPALIRALSAGVCTVSTLTEVSQDLITKDVNGLLTPPENPQALAEAINCALNNSHLRDRLGRTARDKASLDFDVKNLVPAVLNPFRCSVKVKAAKS